VFLQQACRLPSRDIVKIPNSLSALALWPNVPVLNNREGLEPERAVGGRDFIGHLCNACRCWAGQGVDTHGLQRCRGPFVK
jgi:hypothetical protein